MPNHSKPSARATEQAARCAELVREHMLLGRGWIIWSTPPPHVLYSGTNSTSEVPVLAIFTYTPVFLSFRLFCNLALAARRCSMAAGLAATAVRWQQQQASLNSEIRTWIPSWPQMRSKFVPVLEYKTTSMNPRSTVLLLALVKNCIMGHHTGVLNWRYI